jgi:hypothetical protein
MPFAVVQNEVREIKASADATVQAGTTLVVKGTKVDIN